MQLTLTSAPPALVHNHLTPNITVPHSRSQKLLCIIGDLCLTSQNCSIHASRRHERAAGYLSSITLPVDVGEELLRIRRGTLLQVYNQHYSNVDHITLKTECLAEASVFW